MKKLLLFLTLTMVSCASDDSSNTQVPAVVVPEEIRSADMSYLPLIESEGTLYKHNNVAQDAITTLKNAGCNTIRMRLWYSPTDAHCGFAEVKALAARVRSAGLKVWLTVHYSDTWADPGNQAKPAAWQSMSFIDMKSAVATYTTQIMTEINPDIIQIGNETNDGMLWPEGKLSAHEDQYKQLVTAATTAIRAKSDTAKIMLHFAGINGADWYFSKVSSLDFDYIGLSYYPVWHGKSLDALKNTMNTLGQLYNKKVVIAETAYPFTLGYNDYTNNIVGLENQLITTYPATAAGQKNYLLAIKSMIDESTSGIGFSYWGSEWVAFRGPTATNGSSFENQALWDFNNNALPALDAFNDEN